MVFWFAGGGEAASAGDEQGQRCSKREQRGPACGIPQAAAVFAFFLLLFPVGEDDDKRCGADLTVTRVQIERLWFDRPKRSAGGSA